MRELDAGSIYHLASDCDGMHPEILDAAIDAARRESVNQLDGRKDGNADQD